jgi:hypothetical protein
MLARSVQFWSLSRCCLAATLKGWQVQRDMLTGGKQEVLKKLFAQELGLASLCLAVNLIASNPYRSDRLLSGLGG